MMRWLLILMLLAGCTEFLSTETDTLDEIEAFIGAEVPLEAQNVQYESAGFQDTIVWLRFEASPAIIEAFIVELGYTEALTPGDPGGGAPSPEDIDWLDTPADASATFDQSFLYYTVQVVETSEDLWAIYLTAFNT